MDNLQILAEKAATKFLQENPNFVRWEYLARLIALAKALERDVGDMVELRAACVADKSLEALSSGWIQVGMSGSAIQPHMLPSMILQTVIQGGDVADLIEDCRKFAADGCSGSSLWIAVAGVVPTEPMQIAENTTLLPWESVPECRQKSVFEGLTDQGMAALGLRVRPNSAIRVDFSRMRVLHTEYPWKSERYREERLQELTAKLEFVQDVVRSLTVHCGVPVGQLGSWEYLENAVAREMSPTGFSYGRHLSDPVLFGASLQPHKLSSEFIVTLRKFRSFPKRDLRVLRIASDRINSALREIELVDRAIDLGIALEALLLHDAGGDRGELKFRTAIRGAAFLGGSRSRRLQTFSLLKSAYDHRSKAVHTGSLGKEPDIAKIDIDAALVACAEIAKGIIQASKFPNWDEEYVIGASHEREVTGWSPFKPRRGYFKR